MTKNKYCTFYIVRHGQTDWNVENLIQGHSDRELNELGRDQAEQLAKQFKNIKFDLIFSSDLWRAKQTAEIIALNHKLVVNSTKLMRERSFGKLEGKHRNEFGLILETITKMSETETYKYRPYKDYETDEEVISRIVTFFREVAISSPGKTILVATHGGLMRTLLRHVGFVNYKELPFDAIENTAFIKLRSDGVNFVIDETKGIKKVKNI
ncbi:MAG TPA: histidine phosphatase family protein [Candidatus Saccharimonadales bacterium]|nr:histidine phosphatase family protein [Candidatus Saccharimonadales bacterium]